MADVLGASTNDNRELSLGAIQLIRLERVRGRDLCCIKKWVARLARVARVARVAKVASVAMVA